MAQGLDQLKALLFDDEAVTLADLRVRVDAMSQRLDQLGHRVGTDQRLAQSVASVLDEAFKEADRSKHAQVAAAVAPLVLHTVQQELRNSRDELVQVLYPETGRMVKSYIASAMKDLVDSINRRLEQNPLMLRLRSVTTGRSAAELAIADSQRLEVDEVFLIRRGSGELLGRWPDTGRELSNSDVHLSGVLSAINDFASHAFTDDGGNVRNFELDSTQVFLRASPVYLLAAKCRGVAPAGVEGIFDEEFLNVLSVPEFQSALEAGTIPAGDPHMSGLVGSVERRVGDYYSDMTSAGMGMGILKLILFLMLVPLFAWIGWGVYTDMEEARVRSLAESVLVSNPGVQGYPVRLDVGYRGHEVTLFGLVASTDVRDGLITQMQASLPETSTLADQLTVLPPPPPDTQPQILRVRRELSQLEADMIRAGVGRALDRSARRIEQTLPELKRLEVGGDANRRAAVRQAFTRATQAAREVATFQSVALASREDLSSLRNLTDGINALSGRLRALSGELAVMLGGTAADVQGHAATDPQDVAVAAEELAAQAERLATIAVAVTQASLVRPAPTPPPPPPPAPIIKVEPPSPRQVLANWIEENAVFFSNNAEFRDPVAVGKTLDQLVALMRQTDALIRIVGYTDERGGNDRNTTIAQQRAEAVHGEMVRRGIAADRLATVGRASVRDISAVTGPESPNRRVEFEFGFRGESSFGGR